MLAQIWAVWSVLTKKPVHYATLECYTYKWFYFVNYTFDVAIQEIVVNQLICVNSIQLIHPPIDNQNNYLADLILPNPFDLAPAVLITGHISVS